MIHHNLKRKGGFKVYEERIVLFRARDFDEAIRIAEKEAEDYCLDLDDAEYLGHINVFDLSEDKVVVGSEVYSLMRESRLSPSAYLKRFFESGGEKTRLVNQ